MLCRDCGGGERREEKGRKGRWRGEKDGGMVGWCEWRRMRRKEGWRERRVEEEWWEDGVRRENGGIMGWREGDDERRMDIGRRGEGGGMEGRGKVGDECWGGDNGKRELED